MGQTKSLETSVKVAVGVGVGVVSAGCIMAGYALAKTVPFSGNILIDETTLDDYLGWRGSTEICLYQRPGKFSHASLIFRGKDKQLWTRVHLVLIKNKWFICIGPMRNVNPKYINNDSSIIDIKTMDLGQLVKICAQMKPKTYNYINSNCRHFARTLKKNLIKQLLQPKDSCIMSLSDLRRAIENCENDFMIISHKQMTQLLKRKRLFDWIKYDKF
jgi:hypothetical protein